MQKSRSNTSLDQNRRSTTTSKKEKKEKVIILTGEQGEEQALPDIFIIKGALSVDDDDVKRGKLRSKSSSNYYNTD